MLSSQWTGAVHARSQKSPLVSKVNLEFLCTTAATAVARLSHRNSVRLFVCASITRVDQSKTVQARITKSSPSAAWKTSFRFRKAFP